MTTARGAKGSLAPARPPAFQRALQDDQQRGQLDGLGEELIRAFLDGADRQIDGSVRREHDDRQVLQLGQQIQGIAVGQPVVHHGCVGRGDRAQLQRALAVLRLGDLEPLVLEKGMEREPDRLRILDQENPPSLHGRNSNAPRVRNLVQTAPKAGGRGVSPKENG